MRKQAKLVAVLSAAALLAIGASMTSLAATGWQEENGTWVYYDRNGDMETERWEPSGNNWFYLNSDGEMATDTLVEYNDNYYYVNSDGVMVTNQWVSVPNDDYDGSDPDQPANYWYYFQSNGKALRGSSTSSTAAFKEVNGKKYIFDDEGKMLYGWIDENGQRVTGDDAWNSGLYYCGTENDGAQVLGWKQLDIVDSSYNGDVSNEGEPGVSSPNVFDDENQSRWFYFNTNGKKFSDEKAKTINGKKYSFDDGGRMNAEWIAYDATPTIATGSNGQGSASYTTNWRYYGSPENGARITKGWFQVVPDSYLSTGDYNDDSENWYYSDKDGKLVAGELATVNGKKYAFNNSGVMQSGLKFIRFDGTSKTKFDPTDGLLGGGNGVKDAADHSLKFDTYDNFNANAGALLDAGYNCYYFGNGDDGSMKTNRQTVGIDGDNYTFLFNKAGGFKGAGKNGIDSSKYYMAGMLLMANKDDKYAVVKTVTKTDDATGAKTSRNTLLTADAFMVEKGTDGNPIAVVDTTKMSGDKYESYYDITNVPADTTYTLVNTTGSIQKGKNKAKDGNDNCYVSNTKGEVTAVYVES